MTPLSAIVAEHNLGATAVNRRFHLDEKCQFIAVHGRYTAEYAINVLAQANRDKAELTRLSDADYEAIKPMICFTPKQFLFNVTKPKERQRGLIWIHADLWLYMLDWYDPIVKKINECLQKCTTKIGTIYLTTQKGRKLINQKYSFQGLQICNVKRPKKETAIKQLMATVYEKGKVKYRDRINAGLPQVFREWLKTQIYEALELGEAILEREISNDDLKKKAFGDIIGEAF